MSRVKRCSNGLDRVANAAYSTDVDLMIYHYLQYNTGKAALAALKAPLSTHRAETASLVLTSFDGGFGQLSMA